MKSETWLVRETSDGLRAIEVISTVAARLKLRSKSSVASGRHTLIVRGLGFAFHVAAGSRR